MSAAWKTSYQGYADRGGRGPYVRILLLKIVKGE
jgi:hypothetical protein